MSFILQKLFRNIDVKNSNTSDINSWFRKHNQGNVVHIGPINWQHVSIINTEAHALFVGNLCKLRTMSSKFSYCIAALKPTMLVLTSHISYCLSSLDSRLDFTLVRDIGLLY